MPKIARELTALQVKNLKNPGLHAVGGVPGLLIKIGKQNTIAATILPMRRLFMIFLLVLMPLQLSWAAMASYCQHETGAAAKHFGHHDHQHKAADGKDAAPDPAKTGGGDPDCASCHAGGTSVLADALTIHLVADSSLGTADHRARLTSPPFERIERPQWRVLA